MPNLEQKAGRKYKTAEQDLREKIILRAIFQWLL